MKKAMIVVICILYVSFLTASKFYWEHKKAETTTQSTQHQQKKEHSDTTKKKKPSKDIDKLTDNLPKGISEKIKKAKQNNKRVRILAITDSQSQTWPGILQKQLNQSYGQSLFKITKESYKDKTTLDFLNSGSFDSLFNIPSDTDIILFESMILNNLGKVSTEDTLFGTTKLSKAIKDEFPNMVFVLQPPNPVYHKTYYTEHVQELKEYAEEHDITYIDYWKGWPDPDSDKLLGYLEDDHTTPNDKGNQLWADVLSRYFTSQLTDSQSEG